jgi:hypothetical protein
LPNRPCKETLLLIKNSLKTVKKWFKEKVELIEATAKQFSFKFKTGPKQAISALVGFKSLSE